MFSSCFFTDTSHVFKSHPKVDAWTSTSLIHIHASSKNVFDKLMLLKLASNPSQSLWVSQLAGWLWEGFGIELRWTFMQKEKIWQLLMYAWRCFDSCLQLWLIQQQPINCIIIKGPQQKEAMCWCIELMIDEHCNPSLMSAQMVHHERISYSQQMCWWIKLMTDEHCHPESWTEQGLAPSSSLGGMSITIIWIIALITKVCQCPEPIVERHGFPHHPIAYEINHKPIGWVADCCWWKKAAWFSHRSQAGQLPMLPCCSIFF